MPDYEIHWTEKHCDVVTAETEERAIIEVLDNISITCVDAQAFFIIERNKNAISSFS